MRQSLVENQGFIVISLTKDRNVYGGVWLEAYAFLIISCFSLALFIFTMALLYLLLYNT